MEDLRTWSARLALAALPFSSGRVPHLGRAFGFATHMPRRRGYGAAGEDASAGSARGAKLCRAHERFVR